MLLNNPLFGKSHNVADKSRLSDSSDICETVSIFRQVLMNLNLVYIAKKGIILDLWDRNANIYNKRAELMTKNNTAAAAVPCCIDLLNVGQTTSQTSQEV